MLLTSLSNFARIFTGLALALVCGELMAVQVFSPRQSFDPAFGAVYAASASIRYNLEGHGTSSWGEHGIRRGSQLTKNGQIRILVLGDSLTEALQVNDEETYVDRAEQALTSCGYSAGLLNAGKAGTSVADYLANARLYQDTFAPVWTVIELQESDFTSDAWNDHKQNKTRCYLYRDPKTDQIRICEPPKLVPEERGLLRRIVNSSRNRSALLQFGLRRAEEFLVWVRSEPPLFRASQSGRAQLAGSSPRYDDFPVEQELEMLREAFHDRITILYLSEFNPRNPGVASEFERYLLKLCRTKGLSVVATSSEYPSLGARELSPFGFNNSAYNFGHLNVEGHKVTGKILSVELQRVIQKYGLY